VKDGPLADRIAVITGSTKGIGLEIARTYLASGARVMLNSRSPKDVEAARDRLAGESGPESVDGLAADVGELSECKRLVEAARARFGGIDILVNNAGTSMVSPSLELSAEDWERTLRTDLSGPFYMARTCAPAMIARGGGSIINISSILGLGGLPKRAAYSASKHGLIGLTKVLATEWACYQIRVNAISPGYIRTDMDTHDAVVGDYTEQDIEGRTPLGRYGTAQEVARVALFLASQDSAYVTGESIAVDGGWTAYAGWDKLLGQIRRSA
jgi:3-oxoacyl-[acyl-carrier protein] reductase